MNNIEGIKILDETNKSLFEFNYNYIIPLYQRSYAWTEKEIIELIEDIYDNENDQYYLGSLIVYKRNELTYEVIDGQQRLTTLYLLINCLDKLVSNQNRRIEKKLTFECRDKSNYTLENINELGNLKIDKDKIEQNIENGIKVILEKLTTNFDIKKFINNLKKTVIYLIEVPPNTDLNRYFEIMNTRGEQLEQHNILKATLMSYLKNPQKENAFGKIWDALSDMDNYAQLNFNVEDRKKIYSSYLNGIELNSLDQFNSKKNRDTKTIKDILNIKPNLLGEYDIKVDNSLDKRDRFESIIEFPYFLLHALKVFIQFNNIVPKDGNTRLVDESLDDKKLCKMFSKVIENGKYKEGNDFSSDESKKKFSEKFIICLLKLRFLFDKYILKREFIKDNIDGEWSIKCIEKSNDSYKYVIPWFDKTRKNRDNKYKRIIRLQECLRVSYTSPKNMHWLTRALEFLYEHFENQENKEWIKDIDQLENVLENYIKNEVIVKFLTEGNFDLGVETPHIVLNYIDYLLYKNDKIKKYENYSFEFRTSVEHFYPQNPSKDTFAKWDRVDMLGNLCLVQRNTNSKFSNLSPYGKKISYAEEIKKGSLKLREMADCLKSEYGEKADEIWRISECEKHQEKMLLMLKEACSTI